MYNRYIPLLILLMLNTPNAQTFYNWPCAPFDQQHYINGTFCENRPSGSISIHHFHDGLDIHLPQGNNVYSVINGSITSLGYEATYGINAYVRVGRYAYVHVDPSPAVQVGSSVTAFQTVVGNTNSWNHIHFKDGYVNSEINGLRANGGLSPMDDSYPPYIDEVNYYINGTTTRFANNRVSGLVEIVAKARDKTDNGSLGNNNGIHAIGYQIYDQSGTIALSDSIINIDFTRIPPSDSYVTNVYFTGSDISNYFYTITNPITRDGYWDTREFDPGTYRIKVFTDDSKLNSKEFWSTVEVVTQDVYPPADPVLTDFTGNDANQWTLNWMKNDSTDVSGYELYFSYDGDYWIYQPTISEQLGAEDTSFTWENFGNDETIYFKLKTYDRAAIPNFSDFSDGYGIRLSASGPQVLLIDGFDRTDGYWNKTSHNYNPVYGNILSQLNLAFNSASDEAVSDSYVNLDSYPNVIYFLGDESSDSLALSPSEQIAIMNYLEQGGNLFICGSEIGSDLINHGTEADSTFYADYLKANLVSDSAATLIIEDSDGTIFGGLIAEIIPPPGTTVRPDVIDAIGGAEPILTFSDGTIAGIHYKGKFSLTGEEANVVYFTFPLELISDANARRILMEGVFQLFGVNTNIAMNEEAKVGKNFSLSDNFPNPFNPETVISWHLAIGSRVELSVYNLLGEKVTDLVSRWMDSGNHSYTFNAKNLPSGVYYYQLVAGDYREVKKMVLIR